MNQIKVICSYGIERSVYDYKAPECKGFALPDQKNIPNKLDYFGCKDPMRDTMCNSEFRVSYHSKGAGRNRTSNKVSYKFGTELDFETADLAFNLLKQDETSGTHESRSFFDYLVGMGFDLATLRLSIKKQGKSRKCYFGKDNDFKKPYMNELLIVGTKSQSLTTSFGLNVSEVEAGGVDSCLSVGTLSGSSILDELNSIGFDLSTLEISVRKVLVD